MRENDIGSLVANEATKPAGAILAGPFRYTLWRQWDSSRPRLAFVMLNPSSATGKQDDPTLRRCMGFAHNWGYGFLEIVNLFAYRSPSPARLRQVTDPVGPEDDFYLLQAAGRAHSVVAAWGSHGGYLGRDRSVTHLLLSCGVALHCLGVTQGGFPRHPLYLPGDTALQGFLYGGYKVNLPLGTKHPTKSTLNPLEKIRAEASSIRQSYEGQDRYITAIQACHEPPH